MSHIVTPKKLLVKQPQSLLKPLDFPRKLLAGPGPSNPPPRVLAANALPLLGHIHPEFIKVLTEVKEGIRYAFQTRNTLTFAVSGTGHAAMETACTNLVESGDIVLVTTNGLWGNRFAKMARRHDAVVKEFIKNAGEVFSHEEIEKALEREKPSLLFVTHGESSTTTLQDVENLGHLCHRYSCLLVVDAVASLGAAPLYMDDWGIDVLYTGAQKVLSVPPGASPISFSDTAWQKILKRRTPVRSFYLDVNYLGNYWGCDDLPKKNHHTAPINNMYALREGLAILAEEGLAESWRRHQACADLLYSGLQEMGLQCFVTNKKNRLPSITAIKLPPNTDWREVCKFAEDNYKVSFSGGLGPTAGKVWRVGVMGNNATPDTVHQVLRALKHALQHCGNKAKL